MTWKEEMIQMKKRFWRILFWGNVIARVLLLAFHVLCLFSALVFEPPIILTDISLQHTRCERVAKDVLVLQYHWSNTSERAQAISELQDLLPLWEREQATIGRSKNAQVQLFMLQAAPDFFPIDIAVRSILAHDTIPADPIQVQIVLAHERDYTLTMNQLLSLLEAQVSDYEIQLFISEMVALILILVLTIIDHIVRTQEAKRAHV
jgi:hypothetical protein